MDRDELKATFHRVNAYRHVCRAVRATAGGTLFHGVLFAIIALMIQESLGTDHPIFIVCAFMAVLEISVGIWKKVRPSAECVLVDSLNSIAFGGSLIARFVLAWQGVIAMRPDPIGLAIGVWVLFTAWRQFQYYLQLRRLFVERPTRTQMDYVDEMVAEIRDSDPNVDATALDLDSDPRMKAMLADELVFVVVLHSNDTLVVDRNAVQISPLRSVDGRPGEWLLALEGQPFELHSFSDADRANYARWKGEPA